ncbi:hypothetical protein CRX72_14025 [Pantoea sp. BRM17]|nr:hypothetical protein CRX72_14025 [Pantoea sp. BRM17]
MDDLPVSLAHLNVFLPGDRHVEVLACGPEQQVETLISWLQAGGPRSARVDNLVTEPCEPTERPASFTTG